MKTEIKGPGDLNAARLLFAPPQGTRSSVGEAITDGETDRIRTPVVGQQGRPCASA